MVPSTQKVMALFVILMAMFSALPQTAIAESPVDLLLILDASGSMWQQIEGQHKIVIARQVLKDLITELPDGSRVGLLAYGHRREGDCEDIELIVPLSPLDREALLRRIEALNPKGKTPITGAIEEALDAIRSWENDVTVVLVSDGIETCGGDPCQKVRAAKKNGMTFVMHVIGFDVGEVDVSQLECTAQAGGGLYYSARNADELASALDQAVESPDEMPNSRLSVTSLADGELADALVQVFNAENGDEVAHGRTYTSPETNPRIIPLVEGRYDVEVQAMGIKGNVKIAYRDLQISSDQTVEKTADFSTGELAVEVTRNGELSDATVNIYAAGTREQIAGGRTYTVPKSNPRVFRLTPGDYDVAVKSVEISSRPEELFKGVVVKSGERVGRTHEFQSGTLRVGAVHDGQLVDVTVNVVLLETTKSVGSGRTYTNANSNPTVFEVLPGKYSVMLKAVRLEGKPTKQIEVAVEAGQTVEHIIDFAN